MFNTYFLIRLIINVATMVILIRFIYVPAYNKRDNYLPFFMLNFLVFLLAYMFGIAKAFDSMSSAFGLLAAFSLLRFRTESITTKDMTYLFIVTSLGLINSVMKGSYVDILLLNVGIIGAVFVLDSNRVMRNQKIKTIEYDKIDNIKPQDRGKLVEEIKMKTGLDIQKIDIQHIDLTKSRVILKVYYY